MSKHHSFHHLSDGEIYQIEILCREHLSIPTIAKRLGRHKSTLYEFFRVNDIAYGQKKKPYGRNFKIPAHGKCMVRFMSQAIINKRSLRKSQASSRYCRIEPGGMLEAYIATKLRLYWSPEQIAGRWKKKTDEPLSKDTIYQHLYCHWRRSEIKQYLRRKCKQYRNRKKEAILQKYGIQERTMIDERPDIINTRSRIGDWEADTIVGKFRTQLLATFVERKTGYSMMQQLTPRDASGMLAASTQLFKRLPGQFRHSITYDNGRENAEHYKLKKALKIETYFCHPYHSWERGSIENLNMLLRQFIPKQTDFTTVSNEQLQSYQDLLNSRPRKRLNYLTPHEAFWGSVKSRNSV